jgi:hypothetical protein
MKLSFKKFQALLIAFFVFTAIHGQSDSVKPNPLGFRLPVSAPKPYAEIITAKAKSRNGLFKVHKV